MVFGQEYSEYLRETSRNAKAGPWLDKLRSSSFAPTAKSLLLFQGLVLSAAIHRCMRAEKIVYLDVVTIFALLFFLPCIVKALRGQEGTIPGWVLPGGVLLTSLLFVGVLAEACPHDTLFLYAIYGISIVF